MEGENRRQQNPAVGAVLDGGQGQDASEWVPATFQDRRHIGRRLTRLVEDFHRDLGQRARERRPTAAPPTNPTLSDEGSEKSQRRRQ